MENEPPKAEEAQEEATVKAVETRGSSLPLILIIAALLVWFVFQTVQLLLERNSLIGLRSNLEAPVQESQKMQAQLQALVTKTAELANQGNPGAKAVVDELEKRGIPVQGASAPPAK